MAKNGSTVHTISNVCSVAYFVLDLLPWVLFMEPFMMLWSSTEIISAFSGTAIVLEDVEAAWLILSVVFVTAVISLVIPGLWPMYRKLPWLLPYVIIGFVDALILTLGMQIAYASGSILLTVLFLVAARVVECVVLYLHPIPAMRARKTPAAE